MVQNIFVLCLPSRMRPSHHSRSSLLFQCVQTLAAFLWIQLRPKNLQRRPARPPKVRRALLLHICSFGCHLSWCCLILPYIYIYIYIFNLFFTPTTDTMTQTSDKQTLSVKRPIHIGPKVSIQPKPMITAVPLAHAQAPIQAKTIIIQPLQATVLPLVKPAPINIQPAPPTGQISHHNTYRHIDVFVETCSDIQHVSYIPSGAHSLF